MADNKDKLKELQRETLAEAKAFTNLFSSAGGEKVLEILESEFNHSPICLPEGSTRSDTARAAQVDVISFIHLNIKIGRGEQNGD